MNLLSFDHSSQYVNSDYYREKDDFGTVSVTKKYNRPLTDSSYYYNLLPLSHGAKMLTLDELATVAKVIIAPNDFSKDTPPGGELEMRGSANGVAPCFTNCSGHGLCHQGECWCEVQFRGSSCQTTNLLYYTIFACLFFLLSLISLIQLAVCVQAEYHKRHKPTIRDVFRLTNQKLVYFFVTIATASRGFYFAIQLSHPVISFNLQTVYYPLILTIFSLIVCKWAEWFHINDMPPHPSGIVGQSPETPNSRSPSANRFFSAQVSSSSSRQQCMSRTNSYNHQHQGPYVAPNASFLTKSLGAFVTFNVLMYILLFLQLLATNTWVKDIAGKKYWMRISKACFASLTLLVVVFFLIYGVEMFFKVRGAFVDANRRLNTFVACSSRLSLIAQAACLLFLALFLFSDVAFIHFEKKITDLGISYFDTACRAVDLCVAIWFPLVLWKSAKPDELWLLNPRVLFQKPANGGFSSQDIVAVYTSSVAPRESSSDPNDFAPSSPQSVSCTPSSFSATNALVQQEVTQECFICYDSERDDAGPLIKPCKCKGDTSVVHHDCLRRWILESIGGVEDEEVEITNQSPQIPSSAVGTTNYTYTTRNPQSEQSESRKVESVSFSSSSLCSSRYPTYSGISFGAETLITAPGHSTDISRYSECQQENHADNDVESDSGIESTTASFLTSRSQRETQQGSFRLSSGGLGLLLGGAEARNHLKCKVCNQPYELQTSFMIQCQAQNWRLWSRWILGLSAMTALPFAASAVFQITTEPAPRVLALAVLFLLEYALWRLAGFNLVTLYNYAKFSSFRIEGKEVHNTIATTNTQNTTSATASNIPKVTTSNAILTSSDTDSEMNDASNCGQMKTEVCVANGGLNSLDAESCSSEEVPKTQLVENANSNETNKSLKNDRSRAVKIGASVVSLEERSSNADEKEGEKKDEDGAVEIITLNRV